MQRCRIWHFLLGVTLLRAALGWTRSENRVETDSDLICRFLISNNLMQWRSRFLKDGGHAFFSWLVMPQLYKPQGIWPAVRISLWMELQSFVFRRSSSGRVANFANQKARLTICLLKWLVQLVHSFQTRQCVGPTEFSSEQLFNEPLGCQCGVLHTAYTAGCSPNTKCFFFLCFFMFSKVLHVFFRSFEGFRMRVSF